MTEESFLLAQLSDATVEPMQTRASTVQRQLPHQATLMISGITYGHLVLNLVLQAFLPNLKS